MAAIKGQKKGTTRILGGKNIDTKRQRKLERIQQGYVRGRLWGRRRGLHRAQEADLVQGGKNVTKAQSHRKEWIALW